MNRNFFFVSIHYIYSKQFYNTCSPALDEQYQVPQSDFVPVTRIHIEFYYLCFSAIRFLPVGLFGLRDEDFEVNTWVLAASNGQRTLIVSFLGRLRIIEKKDELFGQL